MIEAQEMFKNANRLSRPEKAIIIGFMAGSRDNPYPDQGDVVQVRRDVYWLGRCQGHGVTAVRLLRGGASLFCVLH